MIKLLVMRGKKFNAVSFYFPATPGELGEYTAKLDKISDDIGSTKVIGGTSTVKNLVEYLKMADMNDPDTIEKLNVLAEKVGGMSAEKRWILSGALETETINSLDDILHTAESLERYLRIPDVSSDGELGTYLVNKGFLADCPRNLLPYLDYAGIGAKFHSVHGGAYTEGGYVLKKDSAPELASEFRIGPWRSRDLTEVMYLNLQTPVTEKTGGPYCLVLPADDIYLDEVRRHIGVEDLDEAQIVEMGFRQPYLAEVVPMDCPTIDDCNELAEYVSEMLETDGELMKYLSVLTVEKPGTIQAARDLAINLDDYERIPYDFEEYGRATLRRIGMDDEMLDAIDGYMDFAALGEQYMKEDGVVQTDFGLVRRCSSPFSDLNCGGMKMR